MAVKSAPKDKAPVLVCPCFNCGQDIKFEYDPERDNPLVGQRAHLKCPICGVVGPGKSTMIESVEAWNKLYYAMQAGNAYNALAGVSSPMEFAAWVKGLKDAAEEIAAKQESFKRSAAWGSLVINIDPAKFNQFTDILVDSTIAISAFNDAIAPWKADDKQKAK